MIRALLPVLCVLAVYFVSDAVNSENAQKKKVQVKEQSETSSPSVPTDPRNVEPLKVGAQLPDVEVRDLNGKSTSLNQLISEKPSLLVFYRGGWCPYCNTHLSDLQKIEKRVLAKGYQVIALSPDRPEELKKSSDKIKMKYKLYSDSEMKAAKALGIAFKLTEEEFNRLKGYKIDVEKASGESHRMLPVPSVFVLDTKGQIQYQYSNPDYKVRLQGGEVLATLDRLNKTKK